MLWWSPYHRPPAMLPCLQVSAILTACTWKHSHVSSSSLHMLWGPTYTQFRPHPSPCAVLCPTLCPQRSTELWKGSFPQLSTLFIQSWADPKAHYAELRHLSGGMGPISITSDDRQTETVVSCSGPTSWPPLWLFQLQFPNFAPCNIWEDLNRGLWENKNKPKIPNWNDSKKLYLPQYKQMSFL